LDVFLLFGKKIIHSLQVGILIRLTFSFGVFEMVKLPVWEKDRKAKVQRKLKEENYDREK
jgi:hypothetical protein